MRCMAPPHTRTRSKATVIPTHRCISISARAIQARPRACDDRTILHIYALALASLQSSVSAGRPSPRYTPTARGPRARVVPLSVTTVVSIVRAAN